MQIFFANGIGFIKISAQLFSQIISHSIFLRLHTKTCITISKVFFEKINLELVIFYVEIILLEKLFGTTADDI